ncbi:MAG: SUMF1/EgtB/PvdO family nonheme iron enzyme [Planctomycetes bacterium]|nr:SUMF1/EgtB/PvdO family nonheme iron enzyme [Planctomycetota bacterium]
MITSIAFLVCAAAQTAPPPSMVLVPGGRTRIGIDVKDVERLINSEPEAANFAGALIAETPRHDVQVDSFWMMVTEVTQEQYGRFVRTGRALPLESWCEEALTRAAIEFTAAEDRAVEAGAKTKRTFDRRIWWTENAARVDWEIPPQDRLLPVVFVDYAAARAYARWAGMRLPTEFEYQRAVRGDLTQNYPWGNEWDDEKFAATNALKEKRGARAVGSFPAGRSKQGVFDLAGNVWEWTSSPYARYPGYEMRVFDIGYGRERRPINAIGDWSDEQRVAVGGSFQSSKLMCRATVRRGTERTQSAGALGFRCAASARAGVDLARCVIEDDFDVQWRPRVDGYVVEYDPSNTLCVDGWRKTQGAEGAPPGYEIVEDYRYVLFAPVLQIKAADIGAFEKRSLDEPVPLGLLSTNVPLADPPLDTGSYLIAYRAKGVRRVGDPRFGGAAQFGKAPIEETLKLDVAFDHLIFADLRGQPLAAVRASVAYGPAREGQMSTLVDAAQDGASRVIQLDADLPCLTTNKGFSISLTLRARALESEPEWRR